MSKALATKNVAAVLVAVALVVGFAFAFATPAKADTLSTLQAQVQALLAQIAALQGSSMTIGNSGNACHTFTRNHKVGENGGEVMWIQQFLNGHGHVVAASGAGSAGNETSHFGPATKAAVMAFQAQYAADILAPVGLTSGTGNWGPSTRAKANALCAGGNAGTGNNGGGVVTPAPTGPGITVSAGAQPANSLAPKNALRVPFTNVTITNNTGAAVTINGVVVQRTGLAADADFASVVLVDSNGLQLGNTQTLDSNHMATIGGMWTLAPGATMTYTVAGNISAAPNAGEVASLTVTGVNTSVAVNGSLPIVGASQTINSTLVVGTVTAAVSGFDPQGATTKNLGSTGVKFTGVRFTAGSAEDLKLLSIRWRINGSASASDLSNVVTIVNGTSYPATLSADGRYFQTVFPGGVTIAKGFSADVYTQGDVTGSNASGRVVELDIDKTSDVYFVGQTYGFGIAMGYNSTGTVSTASTHGTTYASSGNPVFQGSTVTIQGGTVTTIQNATSIASQNIAVSVPNTVLGGFTTNFAGEPVTISGINFTVSTSTAAGVSYVPLTGVTIVDQNGAVVAGPVDMVAAANASNGTTGGNNIFFGNSITFPVGSRTYTIKGKVWSGAANGSTIKFTTVPSSGWASPTGQTTGNSVTISTGTFDMSTMTVQSASLAITAGTSPAAQNVVVGSQNLVMGTIQLDASASGEDVKLSSLQASTTGTISMSKLSGCQLWDGATALTTGTNVINSVSAGQNTFTFDNSLTIAKGTVKTLSVSCNLASGSYTGTFGWGVNSTGFTATGIGAVSSNTVTPTVTSGVSGIQTVSAGATVAVSVDSSSPSYSVVAAGGTGVTAGVIKVRSSNEAFTLQKLGLKLTNGTYGVTSTGAGGSPSSGAGDVMTVWLYNGATLLGTATFTGSSQTATSTFSGAGLAVARDTDVLITVKADLASIGVSGSAGIGNLLTVDPNNFEGVGTQSGTTVRGNGSGSVAGLRLFKSYPTLSLDTLSSSGVADGRLLHFKVTANAAGPVSISSLHFTISTSSATVSNVQLFAFTDSSYSQAAPGQGSGGQVGNTLPGTISDAVFTPTTPLVVSGSANYYFELRASVAGTASTYSVVSKLLGDSAYPTTLTSGFNVGTSTGLIATTTGNFIWAGNSTSTPVAGDVDWANGYSLPGLPSSGIIQTRSN